MTTSNIKATFRAIVDKYKEATSLITAIGVIYANEVPSGIATPYVRFMQLSGEAPEPDFNGNMQIEAPVFQFSIFHDSGTPDAILGYADLLVRRFDWTKLTFNEEGTTATSLLCRRLTAGTLLREPTTNTWHFMVDYSVRYCET